MKVFSIPNIIDSLKRDVENEAITLDEASKELYYAGWTNYIDIRKTRELLYGKI